MPPNHSPNPNNPSVDPNSGFCPNTMTFHSRIIVKGVELTHRNWIAMAASTLALRPVRETPPIHLCTVPLFHVYGFAYCVRAVAVGETVVIAGGGMRFGLGTMCGTIEEFRVSHVAVATPVIVAMVRDGGVMDGYDLSSLEAIGCGGAPLGKSVIEKLRGRLPNERFGQGKTLLKPPNILQNSI